MKKKTVITTETREVWVIGQPGEIREQEPESNENDPPVKLVKFLHEMASEPDSERAEES